MAKTLGIFPLTTDFRGTTLLKAFILNAISVAIVSALSIQVREYLDDMSKEVKGSWYLSDSIKTIIVLISAFTVALVVFFSLWLLLGFGGGLISSKKLSPLY